MRALVPSVVSAVLTMMIFAPGARIAQARSDDAVGVFVDQFRHADLVGFPERHQDRTTHDFLRLLVDRLAASDTGVRNVVVEFGNARYQGIVDRYLKGDSVPEGELRQIWQNTTQFIVWDSPVYAEFFAHVRRRNAGLAAEKRIRVVLGDPPVDWPNTTSADDYKNYANRDQFFADVIDREVLQRGEKALLVIGGMHLLNPREPHREVPDERRDAADLIRRRHPGRLFAFWHVARPLDGLVCEPACAVAVRTSKFRDAGFGPFAPSGILVQRDVNGEKKWVPLAEGDWPKLADMTDGLVYFGEHQRVKPSVSLFKGEYARELNRRAAILSAVYGMDFKPLLEDAMAGR